MKRTYKIMIIPGEPDEGGYWVKVPALPGCVTQGETVEEALSNAKEAIELYVSVLIDDRESVPEDEDVPETLVSPVSVEVPADAL